MANSYLGSPPIWVIDTPSATAITTDWIRLYRIRWVAGGASVAGDECKVTDAANNVIFDEFSTGADFETIDTTLSGQKGKPINGLIVPTLGHGILYLYLE